MTNRALAPLRGARRNRVSFLVGAFIVLGAISDTTLRGYANHTSRVADIRGGLVSRTTAAGDRDAVEHRIRTLSPTTAQSGTSAAAASALPEGWSFTSVGTVAREGAAVYSSGSFGVTGAGTGIDGRADAFSYVYRLVSGDFDAVVRVASLDEAREQAKAGLAVRSSLKADAAQVALLASNAQGVSVESRETDGGITSRQGAGAGAAPVWLKLERRTASVTAFTSADGRSWTSIASAAAAWPSAVYVGVAVTSEETRRLASAVITNVQVSAVIDASAASTGVALATEETDEPELSALVAAAGLPANWNAADVGSPAISGTVTYANEAFTIDAAGRDIWETSDQFTFAYRAMTGDVDIITRVTALENTDPWAKAGVMIRASLNATSRHVSLLATPTSGIGFQRRTSTGGSSAHTEAGTAAAPIWLRLTRSGSTITARRSTNGTSWTTVGTQTLSLSGTFYVGLAVTSHDTSTAATATFRNVSVSGSSGSAGSAPTVSLTAPTAGQSFTAGPTIAVSATASDADGAITKVDFYRGTTLIGTDTTSPYSVDWTNPTAGTYTLTAVATDNSNATTRSAERQVTVTAATNPGPTLQLTSPTGGATFTVGATVAMTATASDSNGIDRVEFRVDGNTVRRDTASPYSYNWTATAGTHTLAAVAYDDLGASTTREVQITVGTTNPAPTVQLTAPAGGATFTAGATVAMTATASDSNGVARVEFRVNGSTVGSDTSSPYSSSWTATAGTHTLTAVAFDSLGVSTVSSGVQITVGTTTPTPTRRVAFTPSTDHATVTQYVLEIFSQGANPATGTVRASRNLAKPTPVNNEITVDVTSDITGLPAGNYIATVTAVSAGGSTRSATSPVFTR